MTIDVTFNDSGRVPTQKPNPAYPDGMHVNLAEPGAKSCAYSAIITVAGRRDDPRTITLPCKNRLDS